jgi:hypothetical protein
MFEVFVRERLWRTKDQEQTFWLVVCNQLAWHSDLWLSLQY